MEIIRFEAGDILEMKKNHPCGSDKLRVERIGGDVKAGGLGCGRERTVAGIKLEKNIKRVVKP